MRRDRHSLQRWLRQGNLCQWIMDAASERRPPRALPLVYFSRGYGLIVPSFIDDGTPWFIFQSQNKTIGKVSWSGWTYRTSCHLWFMTNWVASSAEIPSCVNPLKHEAIKIVSICASISLAWLLFIFLPDNQDNSKIENILIHKLVLYPHFTTWQKGAYSCSQIDSDVYDIQFPGSHRQQFTSSFIILNAPKWLGRVGLSGNNHHSVSGEESAIFDAFPAMKCIYKYLVEANERFNI